MKFIPWLASCVIAGSALGCPAWAQSVVPQSGSPPGASSPTAIVTLAAAIESAWQRAVLARETSGQRSRADAQRAAAASPWAAPPALELSHRDDRWQTDAGQRETEIGLAWPLWLPGERAARGAEAEAGLALAGLAQQAARLRIAGEVREAAWALATHQAEVAQADVQAQSLEKLRDDVERRVGAGDLARADALAARAEWLTAAALQAEARQRLLEANSRWTMLTGLQAWPDATEPVPGTVAVEHPEVQLAAQATELARRRVELVRASNREAPELLLNYRHEVPGRAQSPLNSVGIGVRLPFGTDDRNRPMQAAALSELDIARTSEQRLRERQAADVAASRAALRAAEQQLISDRSKAELLVERAQLIDRSFHAGETSLPELLRALAAANQADGALARRQAALGLARARLQQSFGLLP